jgi:hypothetical protein
MNKILDVDFFENRDNLETMILMVEKAEVEGDSL